jgi:hypothetical protein
VCILIVFIASLLLVEWIGKQKELSSLHGWLYPANEILPQNPCGVPSKDSLIIMLGGITSESNKFPHTVLEVKGEKKIILDRNPNGSLAISLDVLSEDGRIITKVNKGEFIVNQNNYLSMKRTDRSSLQILDQYGAEVLSMRYFNPQAIWINAYLRYPGMAPIIMSGGKTVMGHGTTISESCFKNVGTDISIN